MSHLLVRQFRLRYPPQGINHGYTPVVQKRKGGAPYARIVLDTPTRKWKEEAFATLVLGKPDGLPPGPYAVALCWMLPGWNASETLRPQDIDGGYKFTKDVIAAAWGFDDHLVHHETLSIYVVPEEQGGDPYGSLTIVLTDDPYKLPGLEQLHEIASEFMIDGMTVIRPTV